MLRSIVLAGLLLALAALPGAAQAATAGVENGVLVYRDGPDQRMVLIEMVGPPLYEERLVLITSKRPFIGSTANDIEAAPGCRREPLAFPRQAETGVMCPASVTSVLVEAGDGVNIIELGGYEPFPMPVTMLGGPDDDRLTARLVPSAVVRGGAGNDAVAALTTGGPATADGGPGHDVVGAGGGPAEVSAGDGEDLVLPGTGSPRTISCGPGLDYLHRPAPGDDPAADCEPPARTRVLAEPASGKVRLRLPGRRRFTRLTRRTGTPPGTRFDARRGKVRLIQSERRGGIDVPGVGVRSTLAMTQLDGGILRLGKTAEDIRSGGPLTHVHLETPKGCRGRTRVWTSVQSGGQMELHARYAKALAIDSPTRWLTEERCRETRVYTASGLVNTTRRGERRLHELPRGQRRTFRP
jgi:hypothetical protein